MNWSCKFKFVLALNWCSTSGFVTACSTYYKVGESVHAASIAIAGLGQYAQHTRNFDLVNGLPSCRKVHLGYPDTISLRDLSGSSANLSPLSRYLCERAIHNDSGRHRFLPPSSAGSFLHGFTGQIIILISYGEKRRLSIFRRHFLRTCGLEKSRPALYCEEAPPRRFTISFTRKLRSCWGRTQEFLTDGSFVIDIGVYRGRGPARVISHGWSCSGRQNEIHGAHAARIYLSIASLHVHYMIYSRPFPTKTFVKWSLLQTELFLLEDHCH